MNHLEKFKKNYPAIIEIKVQWGDMDAFGHVNNVMYFRYFESARIAYFERIGVLGTGTKKAVAPILAETSCRYRLPLNYPDTLLVGAKITEKHSHGFMMEYAIFSKQQQVLSSIGMGRIVMLNYTTHEKVAVDTAILKKINSLENITK